MKAKDKKLINKLDQILTRSHEIFDEYLAEDYCSDEPLYALYYDFSSRLFEAFEDALEKIEDEETFPDF